MEGRRGARVATTFLVAIEGLGPSPRSQVTPMWLLQRWAPSVARAANRGVARFASR